jgi:hypothetical protein
VYGAHLAGLNRLTDTREHYVATVGHVIDATGEDDCSHDRRTYEGRDPVTGRTVYECSDCGATGTE